MPAAPAPTDSTPSALQRLLSEERRLDQGLARIREERARWFEEAEAAVETERRRLEEAWPEERRALEAQARRARVEQVGAIEAEARRTASRLEETDDRAVADLAEELVRELVEAP